MNETNKAPKPCPFCKGISVFRHGSSGFYYVECDNCYSRTGDFDTKAEAVAAWNRRCRKNNRSGKNSRTTMSRKKWIDHLSDWEWTTLVAAWRYYEHGHTIVSASFPSDIVRRFWGDGNTYSDEVRNRIAYQFAKTDHGSRGEGDWMVWLKKDRNGEFDRDDLDANIWTTFFQFCRGWVDGYSELTVSNGKRTETVKAFYTEFTKKWTPVDGYIKRGLYSPYIPDENIIKQEGEIK